MLCTHCGLWELAGEDLSCSWCGACFLRCSFRLSPSVVSMEDYPPPVLLHIRNDSPMGSITLERIDTGASWITLLPGQSLPQTVPPGSQHTLSLDVDTFAAGAPAKLLLAVSVRFAGEPQTAVLHLQRREQAQS